MESELTRQSRLSAMLIGAAVIVPMLALPAMLILRRYVWVHYSTRTLELWLVFDAVILAAGLIVRENESVARSESTRAGARKRRSRQPASRRMR